MHYILRLPKFSSSICPGIKHGAAAVPGAKFMAYYVGALLKLTTTKGIELALALNSTGQGAWKRLQGKRDEFLILVVNGKAVSRAFVLYRQRWEIETLFAALRSRGFDLETTHVTTPERIAKIITSSNDGYAGSERRSVSRRFSLRTSSAASPSVL